MAIVATNTLNLEKNNKMESKKRTNFFLKKNQTIFLVKKRKLFFLYCTNFNSNLSFYPIVSDNVIQLHCMLKDASFIVGLQVL